MPKTIAMFGVGPGMGRPIGRRCGWEGFQVALVARNRTRLDTFNGELAANGIKAPGFAGDIADRDRQANGGAPIAGSFQAPATCSGAGTTRAHSNRRYPYKDKDMS